MNIKAILEKLNHNSDTLNAALDVSDRNADTLRNSIHDWNSNTGEFSRVIQIILTHETLTDNEKIFCLVEFGKLIIIQSHFDQILNGLTVMYDDIDDLPLPLLPKK